MPGPDRLRYVADAFRAGLARRRGASARRASIRGSWRRSRTWCARRRAIAADGLAALDAARPARPQAQGLRRQPHRDAGRHDASRRCASGGTSAASGPCSSAWIPAPPSSRPSTAYLYSTYEEECEAAPTDAAQDHDPGRRPEPHRPGHRVRLLLRARRARAARGRVRDHHGQLQPGDGLDRLRHLGPAVLRAAHVRGRDGGHARREAVRRDRAVRRPDAAQAGHARSRPPACRSSAPARIRSTSPRTASASRSWCDRLQLRQPPNRDGAHRGRGGAGSRARSASRSWCVRPTCSAGGRWRSSSPRTTCAPT